MLCTAGIAMSLTQTLIVPLIPMLPSMLDTSATNASWAVTITMAVGAVATPIAGRLADMFGKRRILLVSTGAVGVGSLVCAVAPGLHIFLTGRALQGGEIARSAADSRRCRGDRDSRADGNVDSAARRMAFPGGLPGRGDMLHRGFHRDIVRNTADSHHGGDTGRADRRGERVECADAHPGLGSVGSGGGNDTRRQRDPRCGIRSHDAIEFELHLGCCDRLDRFLDVGARGVVPAD